MDAQLKAKLIEALRSGNYKQGRIALRKNSEFCCLGVLCDLMGASWEQGADKDLFATINGEKQEYYLEGRALVVSGLSESQQETLYHMNDEGKTFAEIADYIEANL